MTHPLPTNLGSVSTIQPTVAQATSLENHKYKSKIHPDYVKIINMISQKSHSLKLFLWKNIFVIGAGFCAAFLGLSFNTNEVSALFVPALSVSMDQANLQVNGNQVINSTDKTTEIPFNFTVNTNNRTGYTATLSSETDNTALTNATSTTGAKIYSISTNLSINNLPNNTWGYKFGTSTNYAPIPALSAPAQIIQTATKTSGNETSRIILGMKLSDNLESGNYTNKLILSFVSNPYQMRAVMTNGPDFNKRVGALDTNQTCHIDPVTGQDCNLTNKDNVEHIKHSDTAPKTSMATINIEDPDNSDYEIKAWFNTAEKTIYYYSEAEKIYLAPNSSDMFLWFTKVKDIDLAIFDTSEVTDMSQMFKYCKNLTSLNLSNFNTSNVVKMPRMFEYLTSLITLNVSSFNTEKVVDMCDMFGSMHVLTNLNIASFRTPKVRNMSGMFYSQYQIQSLDTSRFDTSNVINFSRMFAGNSSIQNLNLSNFDTRSATDMSYMFYGMKSLTSLNISSFNTQNVRNMSGMFSNARALTSLNLSNFRTSNVKDMSVMFEFLNKIENLDLSNFDTSSVVNMEQMFANMEILKNLNISSFNTENVENMNGVFGNTYGLESIDVSNFKTSKVKTFRAMFIRMDAGRNKLKRIYASADFDTTAARAYQAVDQYANIDIFHNQLKLVGGNGTTIYTKPSGLDYIDLLRIDRPGVAGFFTLKS